jgi:hypothetical protein
MRAAVLSQPVVHVPDVGFEGVHRRVATLAKRAFPLDRARKAPKVSFVDALSAVVVGC